MEIRPLAAQDRAEFRAMTFPSYHGLLRREDSPAIGVFAPHPVGLILAEALPDNAMLEVRSVFVEKTHRGQGVATQLFAALKTFAQTGGYAGIRIQYLAPKPALERVLQKSDWLAPRPFVITYKTDQRMGEMPLLDFPFEIPAQFETFAWPDLRPEDRPYIEALLADEPRTSQFVSPFLEVGQIEPLNSVGVRHEGRVIAWSLTHRLDPQTIRYTGIFVHPDFRGLKGMGVGLHILTDSIRRHLPYYDTIPYAMYAVRPDNPFMASLAARYLIPYAIETWEMRYAAYPCPT